MKYIIIILIIFSCGSSIKGPNYNQGKSHNQDKFYRSQVVSMEDLRMKNSMIRARKKAIKEINSHKVRVKKRYHRKLIR